MFRLSCAAWSALSGTVAGTLGARFALAVRVGDWHLAMQVGLLAGAFAGLTLATIVVAAIEDERS